MRAFDDYTTVESCLDGDVILVGEEHGNNRCADLAGRVLDAVEPGAIAIEEPPERRAPHSAAMGEVSSYAKNNGLRLAKIDIENRTRRFSQAIGNQRGLHSTANNFTFEIQEDGNLNPKAIRDAREAVKEQFGVSAWRIMYPIRETEMARNLLTLRNEYDGPVVAAIGAFHVPAVSRFLAHQEPYGGLSSNRFEA